MDKMKKMLKKRGLRRVGGKRGFTLVELLIVMTIIAILVGIVVMSLAGFIGAGRETVCDADQRSLQTAVVAFWIFAGAGDTDWPTNGGGTPGEIPNDINWEATDADGNVFEDDYVQDKPASDDPANWGIDADGIVVANGSGPCVPSTPTPEPTPE